MFAALAQSVNVIAGFAGYADFGNIDHFGIGAYTTAFLMKEGTPFPAAVLAGAALSATLATFVGVPILRLRGHYFAIATIGVGEIVQTLVINWDWAGGARGLFVAIKRPDSLLNFQFHESKAIYYYIALGLLALALGVTRWLEGSRRGYVFRAIREDQDAAASLGVHVAREKHVAMAVSAALTALGGTFWAQYVLFIDPESVFPLSLSILVCLVAVLGGVGSLWGPLLGAAILVPLSEGTRVLIAVFQPAGLIGLFSMGGSGRPPNPPLASRDAPGKPAT
jgi:branched-chain amino acid transport system permease protein